MKKVKHEQNKAFSLNNYSFNELNSTLCISCLQTHKGISRNPILPSKNKGKSPPGGLRSPGIG